jgi:uncharacterized protein
MGNVLRNTATNLNYVLKVCGNGCNINCDYCFEKRKNTVGFVMAAEVLSVLLGRTANKVNITFHGGEPLLCGIDRMHEYLEIVRNSKKVENIKIQSNGLLLNKAFCELFFSEYGDLNVEFAFSLDGTENMNVLRKDYSGGSTFSRVIGAYKLLNDHGQRAGMLSVISKKSLPFYEEYLDLIESIENISFVKINALFSSGQGIWSDESVTPIEFADFLINVGGSYIKRKLYRRLVIEPLLSMFQNANKKASSYCNFQLSKCYNYVTVYPDMSAGGCDTFSFDDCSLDLRGESGSIEEIVSRKVADSLDDQIARFEGLMKKCHDCEIFSFCSGGCLAIRYYFGENEKLLTNYCKSRFMLREFAEKFEKAPKNPVFRVDSSLERNGCV